MRNNTELPNDRNSSSTPGKIKKVPEQPSENSKQFNRLPYDTCAKTQSERVPEGAGKYQLEQPINCEGCFPMDAWRLQRLGGMSCKNHLQIDIDSELKNITNPATYCNHNSSITCDTLNFPVCTSIPVENTRLTNPPSTLRCQGVNRFDTLFHDPQNNSFVTWDYVTYNVPSRIVVKDNFKPILDVPLNQAKFLPALNASDVTFDGIKGISSKCSKNIQIDQRIPSVTWKTFERQR